MYFGVDYYPEQWVFPYGGTAENPEAVWEQDAALMAKAGIIWGLKLQDRFKLEVKGVDVAVYVADFSRAKRFGDRKEFLAAADAGYISQNVYLYCASSGLDTGVRASFDERALSRAMHLGSEQKIILAQAVGYPKPPPSSEDTSGRK